MKLTESKRTTKVRSITVGYKCDVCGKIIKTDSFPDEWHSFSSNHNEWGNDNIDSYACHEVCSAECYAKKLNEILEDDLKGRKYGKIDDMEVQFARKLSEMLNKKARI